MLAGDENLIGLMAVNRELVAQAETQETTQAYWLFDAKRRIAA